VRHRPKAFRTHAVEDRRVGLRRVLEHLLGLVGRGAAIDVRRQPDLHAIELTALLGAVAVAAEDVLPAHAAAHAFARREDRLEVDGAVLGSFGGVGDDDLPEVVPGAEHVRRQDPDLDEVREIAVVVELRHLLHRVRRERVVVSMRDLEQGL
jgi:hypothetical protein